MKKDKEKKKYSEKEFNKAREQYEESMNDLRRKFEQWQER